MGYLIYLSTFYKLDHALLSGIEHLLKLNKIS